MLVMDADDADGSNHSDGSDVEHSSTSSGNCSDADLSRLVAKKLVQWVNCWYSLVMIKYDIKFNLIKWQTMQYTNNFSGGCSWDVCSFEEHGMMWW